MKYFGSEEQVEYVENQLETIEEEEYFPLFLELKSEFNEFEKDEKIDYLEAYLGYIKVIVLYGPFYENQELIQIISELKKIDLLLLNEDSLEADVFKNTRAYCYTLSISVVVLNNCDEVSSLLEDGSYFSKLREFLMSLLTRREQFSEQRQKDLVFLCLNFLLFYERYFGSGWFSYSDTFLKSAIVFLDEIVDAIEILHNDNSFLFDRLMESVLRLSALLGYSSDRLYILNRYNYNDEDIQYAYVNLIDSVKEELMKDGELLKETKSLLEVIGEDTSSDIVQSEVRRVLEKLNSKSGDETEVNIFEGLTDDELSNLDADKLYNCIDKLIKEIRGELNVDASCIPDVLGHYTKMDTMLNYLIKANSNPSYLRLTHSRQLNDPMEGKALLDYLIDDLSKSSYSRSNIYLSSMSTAKDSLPMWKEYGDESKGIFLEYNKTFLEKLIKNKIIEFTRVCYLPKDYSELENSVDPLFFKISLLKKIFYYLQRKDNGIYRQAIAQLSRILYLFKVMDYSYEQEYRILINFDDSLVKGVIEGTSKGKEKEAIGLQRSEGSDYKDFRQYVHVTKDEKGVGLHVYINQEPLKYANVVLGPKVEQVDYIAPYLQLIDQDLTVELSKIPYR